MTTSTSGLDGMNPSPRRNRPAARLASRATPQLHGADCGVGEVQAAGRAGVRGVDAAVGEDDAGVIDPCQPFSKSGYWARGDAKRLHDPRSVTLKAYLRVLRDTQPRAFLLENVPGLAFS
jgi:hypothetical protein